MEVQDLHNPFDYSNVVNNPDLFAGRQAELERIRYFLRQLSNETPVKYLALHGKRSTGKSSLLKMVSKIARDQGKLPVAIELIDVDRDAASFLAKLYEHLLLALSGESPLTLPDGRSFSTRDVRRVIDGKQEEPELPLEFAENLAGVTQKGSRLSELALRTDLDYLQKKINRPIVLIVDEAQIIAEDSTSLSILRLLGQSLTGYAFILSGTPQMLDQINEVSGHILRQFDIIELKGFAETAEVKECIDRPLASIGLRSSDYIHQLDSLVHDLKFLTDGNPHQIQLALHVMFERWQQEKARKMQLTPDTFEAIINLLEAGQPNHQRPFSTAVKKLSSLEIHALNILCCSIGKANLESCWFAYILGGGDRLSHNELQQQLDQFIRNGLIEVEDGILRPTGDTYDLYYLRVLTIARSSSTHHELICSENSLAAVFTRRLETLICKVGNPAGRPLETCCYEMHGSHIDKAVITLNELPESFGRFPFCAEYIHGAMVELGQASTLYLTRIDYLYQNVAGSRWFYSNERESIGEHYEMLRMQDAVSRLGGRLDISVSLVTISDWDSALDWLTKYAPIEARRSMARHHSTRALIEYEKGNAETSFQHLKASMALLPTWKAANNLMYLSICHGLGIIDEEACRVAVSLTGYPDEQALTLYNYSVYKLQNQDYSSALSLVSEVEKKLEYVPGEHDSFSFLMQPRWAIDHVEYDEVSAKLRFVADSMKSVALLAQEFFKLNTKNS